ncbi:MAG: neutral/alkaline non-lysosomal ceramidase N-terminal domain-containing protein, partial [Planctomycetaceae bacterium]|nr:neutral/alkaline non-lysosomal ceramidase N-terminal domain-containing protein [Planctomycetaceae bacterium]
MRLSPFVICCLWASIPMCSATTAVSAEFRAGAAIADVTPTKFPVLVNGGMTSRSASEVTTRINARCVVLDDGKERIGIVVVDSCMMPRPLLDEAKQLASQQTGLKPDHILISATHTHSAPSCMGA